MKEVGKNFAVFLLWILLTAELTYQKGTLVKQRVTRPKDGDLQASFVNMSFSDEGHEGFNTQPEALLQQTIVLLSNAVRVLNGSQNENARRWLESILSKVGDLAKELDTTGTPHLSSDTDYIDFRLPVALTNNSHPRTSMEFVTASSVDDGGTSKEIFDTKPGIPPFETDELVNQLHHQRDMKRQQISMEKQTELESFDTDDLYFPMLDASSNQTPEIDEKSFQNDAADKPGGVKQDSELLREGSTAQEEMKEMNAFEKEEKVKGEDAAKRNAENVRKRALSTPYPLTSQIHEPLLNNNHYNEEKAPIHENGFQKAGKSDLRRQTWLVSHMYQQRPLRRMFHRRQYPYQNVPMKRYLSFGYGMIPLPQRKRSNVRSLRSRYAYYDNGRNPRPLNLVNTHPNYPKLQRVSLVNLTEVKDPAVNESMVSAKNETKIENGTTLPYPIQHQQSKKSFAKRLSLINKTNISSETKLRNPNAPNFDDAYPNKQYLTHLRRMIPGTQKSRMHGEVLAFAPYGPKHEVQRALPELTDIEKELRAGKIVIVSDSLVRTNFEKYPKNTGKPIPKPDLKTTGKILAPK